ncbi:hypothetical protein [Salmonella phage NINP13076]|nr:hypothetical protein [Salmonella phage NINP13076]
MNCWSVPQKEKPRKKRGEAKERRLNIYYYKNKKSGEGTFTCRECLTVYSAKTFLSVHFGKWWGAP